MKKLLQTDFLSFAHQALADLDDTLLNNDRYIELYATRLIEFADGSIRRLLINMPPRHGKSKLGSICAAAWILAHDPSTKIMIVTYSKELAEMISRAIRAIVQSSWFKGVFPTRVAPGHARSNNFATTLGGQVYATSFEGSITGFGADVIIIDDPHDIADAQNPEQMHRTIEKFYSIVVSRLNNPRKGRIMVVAHRIHEDDLSADLLRSGDSWTHLALPLIAPAHRTYDTAYGPWDRKKGELLRADDEDLATIERRRKLCVNPPFDLVYQQGAEGSAAGVLKRRHFRSYRGEEIENLPRFISIDPGVDEGLGRSFSVIQLWASDGKRYYLLDQIRVRCSFRELLRLTKKIAGENVGAPILVEMTANGPALVSALGPVQRQRVERVKPRESKAERLARHYHTLLKGRVRIQKDAHFRAKFIGEFVKFPRRRTDQVDAATQCFDYIRRHRHDIDFTKSNVRQAGTIAVCYNSQPQMNASLRKIDMPAAAASNLSYRAATRPFASSFDASSMNGPSRPQMASIGFGPDWWEKYRR